MSFTPDYGKIVGIYAQLQYTGRRVGAVDTGKNIEVHSESRHKF